WFILSMYGVDGLQNYMSKIVDYVMMQHNIKYINIDFLMTNFFSKDRDQRVAFCLHSINSNNPVIFKCACIPLYMHKEFEKDKREKKEKKKNKKVKEEEKKEKKKHKEVKEEVKKEKMKYKEVKEEVKKEKMKEEDIDGVDEKEIISYAEKVKAFLQKEKRKN